MRSRFWVMKSVVAIVLASAIVSNTDPLNGGSIDFVDVEFFKFMVGSDPYLFFGTTLIGTDIQSATVTPPAMSPVPLIYDGLADKWFFETSGPEADVLSLYPHFGLYTFGADFVGSGSGVATVDFGTEVVPMVDYPTAMPSITSLTWGSPLNVEWTPSALAAGASFAELFIDSMSTGNEVYFANLGLTDTDHLVPANVFTAGESYFLGIPYWNEYIGSGLAIKGTFDFQEFTAPVPEPCTLALLGMGLGLVRLRRRRVAL
jgi:hypothetical protein